MVMCVFQVGRVQETADIIRLPFGRKYEMPLDFRFNNVPHSTWVRLGSQIDSQIIRVYVSVSMKPFIGLTYTKQQWMLLCKW